MKSVIQNNKECFFCYRTYGLESHHIFYGTANRKISEKYGLKVWLCNEHHTGHMGVHRNIELDTRLKQIGQKYYLSNIGNIDDFRRDFGKSYI